MAGLTGSGAVLPNRPCRSPAAHQSMRLGVLVGGIVRVSLATFTPPPGFRPRTPVRVLPLIAVMTRSGNNGELRERAWRDSPAGLPNVLGTGHAFERRNDGTRRRGGSRLISYQ